MIIWSKLLEPSDIVFTPTLIHYSIGPISGFNEYWNISYNKIRTISHQDIEKIIKLFINKQLYTQEFQSLNTVCQSLPYNTYTQTQTQTQFIKKWQPEG